jgi:soluble epoxide hydrolase/lipid-phosphate phosphatase
VHPERVIALAFLAVGYTPPQTEKLDYEKRLKELKEHIGSELYGYWEYFGSHDGWKMLEKNIESFYDLFFPGDPMQARNEISPRGRAQAWIEGDRRTERAHFWDATTRRKHQKRLLEGGLQGPCNWYRMRLLNLGLQSEASE